MNKQSELEDKIIKLKNIILWEALNSDELAKYNKELEQAETDLAEHISHSS